MVIKKIVSFSAILSLKLKIVNISVDNFESKILSEFKLNRYLFNCFSCFIFFVKELQKQFSMRLSKYFKKYGKNGPILKIQVSNYITIKF